MITAQTHKLLGILDSKFVDVVQVEMFENEIFLLKINGPIDTSIYERDGGWNAEVVTMITDPDNKFHRSGNGIDFYEKDVRRVLDPRTDKVI